MTPFLDSLVIQAMASIASGVVSRKSNGKLRLQVSHDEGDPDLFIGGQEVIKALRARVPRGTRILRLEHLKGPFSEQGMSTKIVLASKVFNIFTFNLLDHWNLGDMWADYHSSILIHTASDVIFRVELYTDGLRCRIGWDSKGLMLPEETVKETVSVRSTATIHQVVDFLERVKGEQYDAPRWNCHHFAYYVKLLLDETARARTDDYLGLLSEDWHR